MKMLCESLKEHTFIDVNTKKYEINFKTKEQKE